ncbi:MAG TPA: CapA family protein [Polyangiaceae bacterium]|nr:CapA family protein [Polyangiaceae bacterium]
MGQRIRSRRLAALLLLGATAGLLGVATGFARSHGETAIRAPAAVSVAPPVAADADRALAPLVPAVAAAASAPVQREKAPFVIVAGGDVNLGRECGQAILADPHYDPFRFMGPIWGDADVRFVNLESQLSDQDGETQSPRNRLVFTGPPGGGATLAQAGIAVVSTANNHAWDYGRGALFETLDNLARANVKKAGTGRTLDEAYEPAVVEARGRRIAVVAVTQIWNDGPIERHEGRNYVAWARLRRVAGALERARRAADFVILSYHGGVEYVDAPIDATRRFIDGALKTGLVDVVIGHHPHVPQGVGFVRGRPVFYSLGNFVFAGHDWAPWTLTGFVARLELDGDRGLRTSVCPVALDGHVPKPIAPGDAQSDKARQHLIDTVTSVGGARVGTADARGCFPVEPPAPR